MRVWADKVYGVPPEQVIGSSIVTKFEMVAGVPVLTWLPELNFMDDNVGKPVAILNQRAIAANLNGKLSDKDFESFEVLTRRFLTSNQ